MGKEAGNDRERRLSGLEWLDGKLASTTEQNRKILRRRCELRKYGKETKLYGRYIVCHRRMGEQEYLDSQKEIIFTLPN